MAVASILHYLYLTLSSYPPQTILFTLLVVLLSIRFLPSLLLALFLPNVGIGAITPLSIKGLSWQSEKGPEALKVTARRIGWSAVGSKSCGRGWIVLRLEGVKVTIPKALLIRPPKPRSTTSSDSSPSSTKKPKTRQPTPETPLRLLMQRTVLFLNKRLYYPLSNRIRIFLSSFAPCLSLFALEVSFELTLEDVLTSSGIISAGVEITHRREVRQVGAWVAMDGFKITEVHPREEDPKIPHGPSPPKPLLLPAIAVTERVLLTGNAPVDPELGVVGMIRRKRPLGKATIEAGLSFGQGKEGVHVRVHELKRILRATEEILAEKKKKDDPETIEKEVDSTEKKKEDDKPAALYYLRSLSISLPLFVLSAHYNTPLHILATAPKRPLPQAVAFALTVKNVVGELRMGGTSEGDTLPRAHKDVLGKGRNLGAGAKLEWGEIEGRVKIDGSGADDILPDSAKAFAIGQSSLIVTSTWLPPPIAASLASTSTATCPTLRNFNDDIVIAEGHLGEVRGHATFETLDSALRIFKARPRPKPRPSKEREGKTPLDLLSVKGLPRIVGTLSSEGVELRVQAPHNSEIRELDEDTSYEVEDRFYRNWSSPDLLCLSFPNGSLSFGGEYTDRSVKRTEAERRTAMRHSRRSKEREALPDEVPQTPSDTQSVKSNHSEAAWSPTKELEDALGVPPPPPMTAPTVRRHLPTKPTPAASQDLDVYSLQYASHFHLSADTLNIYILATNDGRSEDMSSWMGEDPKLPSDPIRFDILAVGPIELTSNQKLLGTEIVATSGIPSPSLELASHTGNLNILIETIGVDLWRPPVMGCLKDCLNSYAAAHATSTVRDSSPASAKAPTPLVYSLPFELCTYVAVASFDMRVAGADPKNDEQACRGVAVHSGVLIFEYLLRGSLKPGIVDFPARHSLELREDIRVEANANIADRPHDRQALFKITLTEFHLDPVVDARTTRGHSRRDSTMEGTEDSSADWELKNRAHISDLAKRRRSIVPTRVKEATKGIIGIPEIAVRIRSLPAALDNETGALDEAIVTVEGESLTFRVELFTLYLCLVAFATVKALKPIVATSAPPSPSATRFPPPKRPAPIISIRAEVTDLHLFIVLPHNVPLFGHIRRLRCQISHTIGVILEWDMLLFAGLSPTIRGKWEDILRLRITTLLIKPELNNTGNQPFIVSLVSESARLRIPFRYVFSQIVDNAVSLVKAMKQLIHQLVKGGLDFVLEPEAEEAKKLPKIIINFKMLAVEILDDPFETRLNIIWRAGYEEQIARQERQAAFRAKVEAIRKAEANGGEEESEDDEDVANTPRKTPRVNGRHTIDIEEARYDLRAYDSSHWVKRMRNAVAEQGRREEALNRRLYGVKHNQQRPDSLLPIELVPANKAAPLARATFHDFHFVVSRHSYPPQQLSDYLYDVGKGLPRDTKFSLLVPLHFSWTMDEARVQLRDYPLPLLLVPPMPPGSDPEQAAWHCESDLVVGEELGGPESVRRVPCAVVPAHAASGRGAPYSIVVPRSAMTTKTYARPTITISSPQGTRIGWGNSIQPAIQDVTKVFDTLTKASPDPSERIGFWDKLRLQFHWQVKFLFENDGPVHFHLKGTRDPYALIGFGAGFVKSWRGNVQLLIGFDNHDREFFQIVSDEYVLGIPNLREYVDAAASGIARDPNENDDRTTQYSNGTGDTRYRATRDTDYVKICAKFINGVRWGLGAVLERACPPSCDKPGCRGKSPFHRQCRYFDFIDHWKVHTKTAASISPSGKVDDSFAEFRSDFIHFSISLTSPRTLPLPSNTDASSESDGPKRSEGYNGLHFSPQANTHFWAWWKLFDGSMSLPIRQGKLFPSAQPPSKKFGKHCATIKYRFSLAPLFISHTYRQDSWSDWTKGETPVVGLKGKIGRFNVDLHQREQEMTIQGPESLGSKTVIKKAFYQAEVDCDGVDLRVLSAVFQEPEKAQVVPEDLDEEEADDTSPPPEEFSVADEDLDWVDMDDFADAIYSFTDRTPRLNIMPFVVCPRFTYYRQTDTLDKHGASSYNNEDEDQSTRGDDTSIDSSIQSDDSGDAGQEGLNSAKTKFGNEPSHTCLMGCATDTITFQIASAEQRLEELMVEQRSPARDHLSASQLELRMAAVHRIIERLQEIKRTNGVLPGEGDESFNGQEEDAYRSKAPKDTPPYGKEASSPPMGHAQEDSGVDAHLPHMTSTLYQDWGKWQNRYMVHNPSIQISNRTREVLLKYYYSSRDRKGFMYHLSASAIKFIRDLAKDNKKKAHHRRASTRIGSIGKKQALEEAQKTNRLLDDLLSGGQFWADTEESPKSSFAEGLNCDPEAAMASLPEYFDGEKGHLFTLIKPQISLHSDVDEKSTLILTAFKAQAQVYQVVDLTIPDDPVNRHVLNSTYGSLDGLQAFYPNDQAIKAEGAGATFVPLETLVDLRVEPWGFDRVVPRTSAILRYDKFNQLRMSSKHHHDEQSLGAAHVESHFHTGTDRVSVESHKFSVSANPDHFAAVYNVVTDLLLYSDPLQKKRMKKLEEIVFTHDFSNLEGVTDIVTSLQHRIREFTELAQQYQVHLDELDDFTRVELFYMRAEAMKLGSELGLVVQAITRAQNFGGASVSKTAGVQFEARAPELVWHMKDISDIPFAKFSVTDVQFSWISKQDSSISNRLVIRDLKALNSSPNQVFAEIIAKHDADIDHPLKKREIFAAVLWNSLPPVGGISIVEQLEIHLHPIRLQLEHRVGKQILDYLFSQRRKQSGGDDADDSRSLKAPSEHHPQRQSTLSPMANQSANRSSESLSVSSTRLTPNGRPMSVMSDNRSFSGSGTPSRSSVGLSSASSLAVNGEHRLRKVASTEVLTPQGQEEGLDAAEMRLRASLNRTFILVDISSTVLFLTYHSEKEDHSRLFDIYNLSYKTPAIQYRSKTWSFLDLLDELKRDTIKSVWSQKGQLIGQLIQTAHRKLPLQETRSAAKKSFMTSIKNRLDIGPGHKHHSEHKSANPSPLRIAVREPTQSSESMKGGIPTSSLESPEEEEAESEKDRHVFPDQSTFFSEPDSISDRAESSTNSSEREHPEIHSMPVLTPQAREQDPRHTSSYPIMNADGKLASEDEKAKMLWGKSVET